VAQAAHEHSAAELRREDHERKLRQLASKRKVIEAQIAALNAEGEAEEAEVKFAIAHETLREETTQQNSADMGQLRGGETTANKATKGKR